ncbi:hypothetical protein [Deinococcus sp. RM]|uniref:hypothetical protein n=1 Tax=Deinococcus sp. RM TaxID=2316359 RepID=UPI000E69FE15|nr:hypothetical protein [Deinococcus sp. RM]RIY06392.1 hypothetical protein D3W47_09350 [Deinococcus sp. RM]
MGAALFLPLGVAYAQGCPPGQDARLTRTGHALEAAQRRWQRAAPAGYTLTLYRIQDTDSETTVLTEPQVRGSPGPVEGLFGEVEAMLDRARNAPSFCYEVAAVFDWRYGYPVRVWFWSPVDGTRHLIYQEISDFQPRP